MHWKSFITKQMGSQKVVFCGHCLVTLSVTSYRNIKMALIAAHLNAEVILVVTV